MAGLYGDLPQAKNAADAPAWGVVPKLQPQLKKPALLAPPPSLLRGRGGGRTPAGGRGAGRGGGGGAGQAGGDAGVQQGTGDPTAPHAQPAMVNIFATVKDEYDPMKPNDYEEVLKERERAKREAAAEAERLARLKEMEATAERLRQQEQGPAGLPSEGGLPRPHPYAPIPQQQPQQAAPGDEQSGAAPGLGAGAPLGHVHDPGFKGGAAAPAGGAGASDVKGMTLAQKLLMKMGWREGEGLGRERQGISTPLVMQKTNARAGVIVNAEPVAHGLGAAGVGDKRARPGAQVVGTPSRVLCLRNMVGPGEVDEELEEEVGQECTKYGKVTNVMIFEVTQAGYPAEEAVRIFIEFERTECALKAMVDLQGRFFAGREVRAAFFSEDRFARAELAPQAGEFD